MWCFEKINPKAMRRDPFEGEFFRGEGVSDRIKGHSEALVREVVQNAIDAVAPVESGATADPVGIRFILKTEKYGLPATKSRRYFGALEPHLKAMGLEDEIRDINSGTVPYMVIEDFRTIGLTGDVTRTKDPALNIPCAYPECFFWFWRNIGRSGKTTEQLGRWGLGKTVIPASSRINTFFGVTRRIDDNRTLLMGQSILRLHHIDGTEYLPEGFFCDQSHKELQMPFEDPGIIADFCADFGIDRSVNTGLSVVIPLHLAELRAVGLIKALIANFFVRIIRNEIDVAVQEDGQPAVVINANTLDAVTANINWEDEETGRQAPPPLAFVRAALERKRTGGCITLQRTAGGGTPQWVERLFPVPVERFGHHAALQNGEMVCALVPLDLEMRDRSHKETFFFLAMQKVGEGEKGWEGYVRDGMRIPRVSTGFAKLHYHGMILVEDSHLSDFLGDAEGPAHLYWAESEKRPDQRYRTWVSRLRFVKRALKSFLDLITPPPEELDYNLYANLFRDVIPGPMKEGLSVSPNGGEKTVVPPDLTPGKPKPFRLSAIAGGFHIQRNPLFVEAVPRAEIIVRYDSAGSPRWSPFDFEFGAPGSAINAEWANAVGVTWKKNVITVLDAAPDFTLKVTGFKADTDLVVKTTP